MIYPYVEEPPLSHSGSKGPLSRAGRVSLSIRLNDGHSAHLIKDGRRSYSPRITMPTDTDKRRTVRRTIAHRDIRKMSAAEMSLAYYWDKNL